MDKESAPLLRTKLHIPPQRVHMVARPRLMDKLGEALHRQHRLTLISARAGSGKTTLISEWVHRLERPSAWLSLDAKDNDPSAEQIDHDAARPVAPTADATVEY